MISRQFKSGWNKICDEMEKELRPYKLDNLVAYEKYGALTVDNIPWRPEVFDIIEKYETLSEKVCEICGKPGKLHADGDWIKTLCDECDIRF